MADIKDQGISDILKMLVSDILSILEISKLKEVEDIKNEKEADTLKVIKTKSGGRHQSAHTDFPWYQILENYENITNNEGIYIIYIWCGVIGCLWSSLYYI